MTYVVVKTIKGRQYRYLQRSWREGKKVRTQSWSLGALNPLRHIDWKATFAGNGGYDEEAALKQNMERIEADEKAHQATLDALHQEFGMTMPSDTPTAAESAVAAPGESAEPGAESPDDPSETAS
jgi:hypothetical protein